jgi:hypothetical protein
MNEEHKGEAPVSSLALPRRRLWPLFVVLGVLAAGGAFLVWWTLTRPYPLRVIVAVDVEGQWWEGSKAAALVADEVAKRLTELGFEPVRAGDPETTAIFEDASSLDEAARKLRAAFVIQARISPELNDLPMKGWLEARFDTRLSVRHVSDSAPCGDAPLRGWAAGPSRERVLAILADSVAEQTLDAALPALVGHESVAKILGGSDVALVDKLTPANNFVAARAAALEAAAADYAELDKARQSSEKGPHPLTFVSEPNASERLCAVTNRGVLTASAPVTPHYMGEGDALRQRLELEQLAWRHEGETSVLWRGYSAFTYPAASGRVALIEDIYGRARALTIAEEGKKPVRVKVEGERKLSQPRWSPDGKMVALVDKPCRECPDELSVLELAGDKTKERFRLGPADYTTFDSYRWLDARRVLLNYAPTDDKPALWAVDVQSGERVTMMVPEDGAVLGDPAVSADGQRIAAVQVDADAIVTLEMADNTVKTHPVGGVARALSFSPDGKRIVLELWQAGEDPDIAVLDVASSKVTRLTKNDSPDRFPLFSPDGKRVYFEARNTDPIFGRRRSVSRIAWVPAP